MERLCELLENEVALNKRIVHEGNDMGCVRDHIKMASPNDPRLKSPPLEQDDQYYMWVFNQLNRSRRFEQGIPAQLSLDVYRDYMTLFGDTLDIDELVLLQALDDTFVRQMIKNRSS